jgi:hypothetical protein
MDQMEIARRQMYTAEAVDTSRTYLSNSEKTHLYNLYHKARKVLDDPSHHDRKVWATNEFHKAHPHHDKTSIYKTFDHPSLDTF